MYDLTHTTDQATASIGPKQRDAARDRVRGLRLRSCLVSASVLLLLLLRLWNFRELVPFVMLPPTA